jgi:two-component system, NarL family, sensor kinase
VSARASSLPRVMSIRPAAHEAETQPGVWQRASTRRLALTQFALCSVAVLIAVGTIGALALRHVARDEALRDARALTAALSRGVVEPAMTPAVVDGDPAAMRRLDRIVRERVLSPNPTKPEDSSIVRIKIWDADGRIVYSDKHELIDRHFVLPEDLREAMENRRTSADVSDLSRPENRFERDQGKLVEVYKPMRVTGSGQEVLLEAYHPARDISDASGRILKSFLPVALALLLALALAQLPLAWFLTRRVRAEERERERLTRAGEDALETERRRIAAELHDGVVQDLAGVAYELQAAADQLPSGRSQDRELGDALRRGAGVCRGSMRAIRALLVDLYPSERREQGLDAAVEALARPLRERGVDVAVDMDVGGRLPSATAELVYRAAQEALRNVDRHAAARTASVALRGENGTVTLVVEDDGRGMTGDNLREQHAAGHMGLALLADGVAARGGSLSIESEPGTGTRVRVSLPRD